MPAVVVKDFLGHASVATTENYSINTKPALRTAAAARKVRLEEHAKDDERDPTGGNDKQGGGEKDIIRKM